VTHAHHDKNFFVTMGTTERQKYRVIFKKVSFGVFRIILVFKENKNFTIESNDKVLPLSKFS